MPTPAAAPAQSNIQGENTKKLNSSVLLNDQNMDSATLINKVVREAVLLKASDILFEPRRDFLLIRFRIDGVLYELGQVPLSAYMQVSARIKVLCNLDTTRKSKTQEGQFTAILEEGDVNLRVGIVETVYGELIVIRIHEKGTIVMDLAELGFGQQAMTNYNEIVKQHHGLILVCGPTGCGKTTTLYSTISKLNKNKEYNVMTIEDPVEYKFDGLNQMQTDEAKDFTFAAGLRSILRLSPDIILVGEIRDSATAKIAIESGLTGQLVLSTIHADDSIGALFRLLDLGIEPYLLNSALTGIVAQRLVRKNCPACLGTYVPNQEELDIFRNILGRAPDKLYKSKGCPECQNMGYSGRVGIYEVLPLTARIRDLLRQKINEVELRRILSQEEGLVTLFKDGLEKCEQGVTSLEELFRNSVVSL